MVVVAEKESEYYFLCRCDRPWLQLWFGAPLIEARVAPVQVKSACSNKEKVSVRVHAVQVWRVRQKLLKGVEKLRKE